MGDEPDLLGHACLVIVDTLFQAMMDGEDATVASLFPEAMTTAPSATGAAVDLSKQPVADHLAHAAAPLVDVMLISGYALLLHVSTAAASGRRRCERPGMR